MRAPALTAAILIASASHSAFAAGAHVHGQGTLDVAVENGQVDLFLMAPLGDVTGDEGNDAAALEARFGVAGVFTFAGATCRRASFTAEVTTIGEDDAESFFTAASDEEDDHDGHDDHDDDHDDGHHDEGHHDEDGHEGHGDHHEDDDHADEDHSGHRDARLNWVYACEADPQSITANLFDLARVDRIVVQAVSTNGVQSIELTADANSLSLR